MKNLNPIQRIWNNMKQENGNDKVIKWVGAIVAAVLTWKFLSKKAEKKKIEKHGGDER